MVVHEYNFTTGVLTGYLLIGDETWVDGVGAVSELFVHDIWSPQHTMEFEFVSQILPVEIITFNGKYEAENDLVKLDWTAANQSDITSYEIERSFDNVDFEQIGVVNAVENAESKIKYDFHDTQLSKTAVYLYRLKIISEDDSFEYSDVISISVDKINLENEVDVYPNPTTDKVFINIISNFDSNIEIDVFDVLGEILGVYSIKTRSNSKEQNFELKLDKLTAGTYLIRTKVNDEVFIKRLSLID